MYAPFGITDLCKCISPSTGVWKISQNPQQGEDHKTNQYNYFAKSAKEINIYYMLCFCEIFLIYEHTIKQVDILGQL